MPHPATRRQSKAAESDEGWLDADALLARSAKGPLPMSAFARAFGGAPWIPEFPLRDVSPASTWRACMVEDDRKKVAAEWASAREKLDAARPMSARDFTAVLAYDPDGAKMDARLGWPSLGLWFECAVGAQPGDQWALDKGRIMERLPALLDSGASVEAFQALYPQALDALLREPRPDGSTRWGQIELLLSRGWNPNAWCPKINPAEGFTSLHALLQNGSFLAGRQTSGHLTQEQAEAGWVGVIAAAIKAGFEIDSRAMGGLTALGACLANRGYELKGGMADARLAALLAMGADPSKGDRFWISLYEEDSAAREAILSRLERSQMDAAVKPAPSEAGPKARL